MAWKTLTALTLGPRARGQFNKLTDKWLMSERISSIEALACQSCNHDGFFFWLWEDLPREDFDLLQQLVRELPKELWILTFNSRDGSGEMHHMCGTHKDAQSGGPFEQVPMDWGCMHYDIERAIRHNIPELQEQEV